jgi:glycosyltransferase involved in cell wall biosynthesis
VSGLAKLLRSGRHGACPYIFIILRRPSRHGGLLRIPRGGLCSSLSSKLQACFPPGLILIEQERALLLQSLHYWKSRCSLLSKVEPMFDSTTHKPKVTIITPSFNQGRFIEETIQSVLSQDYPNLEYIVVDGGSNDHTLEILRKYEQQLNWVSEKDNGQSQAINKGFRMAKGEILAWLNSDDTYLPGAVTKAADYLAQNPGVMMVYGEGYLLDEAGKTTGRFPATEPFNLWRLINYGDYILQQTVFFRKCLLDEVGWLDEELHYGMDWDFWIRIGKQYSIAYLPEYLGNLREYAETKSFSGGLKRYRELMDIARRHGTRRYPFAAIRYGWESYQEEYIKRLSQLLGEANLSGLSQVGSWLRKRVFYLYFKQLTRFSYPCQFEDGWISDRAFFFLPEFQGERLLKIKGTAEQIPAHCLPMKVRIKINGKRAFQGQLSAQMPFDWEIPVPKSCRANRPLEIKVTANRFFTRGKRNERTHDRFAVQFQEIDLI